jgi:acetyl-CoA acetyltransferase
MEGGNKAKSNDVVSVSAVRTRFGRPGGSLRDIDSYEGADIPMRRSSSLVRLICFSQDYDLSYQPIASIET